MVSDSDSSVRLAVLNCLSSDFDQHLSRSHHVEALTFLLSDENYEIKLTTLSILGRLAQVNPAAVLPPMRLLLMRLISEINNSSDHRLKEEATLMLCTFMRSLPLQGIMKPFLGVLIRTFPLTSPLHGEEQTNVRLTTAGLEAVGELCKVMRQGVLPYAGQLLPAIIWNMLDSSARKKQEVSLGLGLTFKGLILYCCCLVSCAVVH